jgi:hypothetical protein
MTNGVANSPGSTTYRIQALRWLNRLSSGQLEYYRSCCEYPLSEVDLMLRSDRQLNASNICGSAPFPSSRLSKTHSQPDYTAQLIWLAKATTSPLWVILLINNRLTCRLRTCWGGTYFSTLNNDSPENPLQCISHRQFEEILDVLQYKVHRAITLEATDERRGRGLFFHA